MKIFGAVIPEEVKVGIAKVDVLLADITRPNLNVYYEIGYCVGLGKTLAPVLNVSFAHAAADIHKDGLFDIVGYQGYENSAELTEIRKFAREGIARPLRQAAQQPAASLFSEWIPQDGFR
jgi:hypothetical protein